MNGYAPIALFTYNRLWHTQQTVAALQKNHLSSHSDLIVFSDGPKKQEHTAQVEDVREFLAHLTGFRSVRIEHQTANLGLARSITSGVSKVVADHGQVIVLEDDMVTSPHFLTFMNDGLTLYADVEDVSCIHGYRYPIGKVSEPYFVRGADCWGWATWKRAWDEFNPDGRWLLRQLIDRELMSEFNHYDSFPYDKMLRDQIAGKVDSWAIRWKASAFLKNRFTLYYKDSLLKNIGNDSTGTHSHTTNQFDVDPTQNYEGLLLQPVKENPEVSARISQFYMNTRPTLIQKFKAKLKSLYHG